MIQNNKTAKIHIIVPMNVYTYILNTHTHMQEFQNVPLKLGRW